MPAQRMVSANWLSDGIDLSLEVISRAFFNTQALHQSGVLRHSLLWVRLAAPVQVNSWLQNQNDFRNKRLLVLVGAAACCWLF